MLKRVGRMQGQVEGAVKDTTRGQRKNPKPAQMLSKVKGRNYYDAHPYHRRTGHIVRWWWRLLVE